MLMNSDAILKKDLVVFVPPDVLRRERAYPLSDIQFATLRYANNIHIIEIGDWDSVKNRPRVRFTSTNFRSAAPLVSCTATRYRCNLNALRAIQSRRLAILAPK